MALAVLLLHHAPTDTIIYQTEPLFNLLWSDHPVVYPVSQLANSRPFSLFIFHPNWTICIRQAPYSDARRREIAPIYTAVAAVLAMMR